MGTFKDKLNSYKHEEQVMKLIWDKIALQNKNIICIETYILW